MRSIQYIYTFLAVVISGLFSAGCSDMPGYELSQPESDCLALTVSVPLAHTRAGGDELNEYTVNSLYLYFFRKEGHDDDTSKAVFDIAMDDTFEYSRQIRLALPDNALQEGGLFGTDSEECYVYAVANVDKDKLISNTVNGLKSTIIDSNFDKTEVQGEFAMDGFAILSLNRNDRIATGTLSLQRAAAKLTLSVDLPQSIDVEQEIIDPFDGSVQIVNTTYYSRADEMYVWISNGVMRSKLNAPATPAPDDCLYSNDIYMAEGIGSAFTFDTAQPKYSYIQDIPFYSYPNGWDSFSPKGNCFLTLEIPWYYVDANGDNRNVVTYYRLAVQPDKNYIERNTLYDMRVTIGRLGGMTVQQPVDMLFDWNYNMEWNIQTLPTDIKEIKYLLLNNNDFSSALDAYYYEMENESFISIPYNTSHPVEIESVELYWYDYKNDTGRSIMLTEEGRYPYSGCSDYDPRADFAGIEIDATKSTLKLKRDILHIAWNNGAVLTEETAINAYNLRIRLRHINAAADDPSAHATIVVTQIPAIYITTQTTASGTRFINNNNTNYQTGGTYKGYVTTGNSWPSNTQRRNYWLGSYHDDRSGYVKNKHTYILTISKFAEGDNYIIADPRTRDIDNLNNSGTAATSAGTWSMSVNNRQLQYYYPADGDSGKTRYIAPQLRVASQWGVTYQISRTGAERRCASYQEDGRPAGRWRLPTAAEIEYICRLSNKQYIPYLFGAQGETANYWCASGGLDVDNDERNPSVTIVTTTASERRAVRCVYDEWFWKSDTLINKRNFTWGDRRRSVSGNK